MGKTITRRDTQGDLWRRYIGETQRKTQWGTLDAKKSSQGISGRDRWGVQHFQEDLLKKMSKIGRSGGTTGELLNGQTTRGEIWQRRLVER